jgi:ABC-type nitrate/sulfonate/bicarbonate transport system substrate-binding protein
MNPGNTNRRKWLQAILPFAGLPACRRPESILKKIVVAATPNVGASGLHLAHELGYFKQAGLDVEIREFPHSSQILPLLAGGQLDVAFSALNTAVVNAVAGGARIKVVSGRDRATACNNVCTLYVSRKSFPRGFPAMRSLKAKKVAVSGQNLSEFCLDLFLKNSGIAVSDLHIVALPSSEAVAAILGGHVDAFVSGRLDTDPMELERAAMSVTSLSAAHPDYQYSFTLFGRSLLDAPVLAGARFLDVALHGGRDFAAGKTPRFLRDYIKRNRISPDAVAKICRNNVTPDGSIDAVSVALFLDWCNRAGGIRNKISAAQLIDTRFLEKIRNL